MCVVSIANCLTLMRVVISPIFLIFYIWHAQIGVSYVVLPYILLFLLIISELSDAFDGYFARKYDQVTDLGKLMDPMADSIARISVFLTFTAGRVGIPMLLVFIFIYRDSVISTLRTVCALKGFALDARPSGKIKAIIQAIATFIVVILMIPNSLGYMATRDFQLVSIIVISCAAAYTLYSAVDYIYANRRYIKSFLQSGKSR